MIDHDFTRRRCSYSVCHIVNTLQCIEVETTDYVSFGYQLIGKIFVTVIQKNILTARHPSQEIGKGIRHNYVYCFFL